MSANSFDDTIITMRRIDNVDYQSSPVNLITFGQPRIGNELFSKAWRVTHGDDWVPNFPTDGFHRVKQTPSSKSERPRRILFRHLPEEFWIEPISSEAENFFVLSYGHFI
ncbi:hypothetical protein G9A89_009360 [Geosiphon pyriformis]|nr:hypothetical protein G9A89_009360 [Geosiphon pyriformis]